MDIAAERLGMTDKGPKKTRRASPQEADEPTSRIRGIERPRALEDLEDTQRALGEAVRPAIEGTRTLVEATAQPLADLTHAVRTAIGEGSSARAVLDATASLGARVRQLRAALGLTQAGLAAKVGVQKETVYRYESGATTPRGPELMALARALRVSPQWLHEGTGEAPPTYPALEEFLALAEKHPEALPGRTPLTDEEEYACRAQRWEHGRPTVRSYLQLIEDMRRAE